MIYRDFKGLKLSGLGLGMMRLPVIDGNDAAIDEAAAAEMIDYAYKNGINYFDTAWGYHGENSEMTAGKYLSAYSRESYYLATKFPGYDNSNMPKVKEIFERQLEKCRTSYFDFYLFHNVYEGNIDDYMNPEFGILDYLLEQKKNGRIRHLGFSAHGSAAVIKRFLDAYGEHLEFCQLQLNYMDWHFQKAQEKAELAKIKEEKLRREKEAEKRRIAEENAKASAQEAAEAKRLAEEAAKEAKERARIAGEMMKKAQEAEKELQEITQAQEAASKAQEADKAAAPKPKAAAVRKAAAKKTAPKPKAVNGKDKKQI